MQGLFALVGATFVPYGEKRRFLGYVPEEGKERRWTGCWNLDKRERKAQVFCPYLATPSKRSGKGGARWCPVVHYALMFDPTAHSAG